MGRRGIASKRHFSGACGYMVAAPPLWIVDCGVRIASQLHVRPDRSILFSQSTILKKGSFDVSKLDINEFRSLSTHQGCSNVPGGCSMPPTLFPLGDCLSGLVELKARQLCNRLPSHDRPCTMTVLTVFSSKALRHVYQPFQPFCSSCSHAHRPKRIQVQYIILTGHGQILCPIYRQKKYSISICRASRSGWASPGNRGLSSRTRQHLPFRAPWHINQLKPSHIPSTTCNCSLPNFGMLA
jgi:hypothetical protein